MGGTIQTIFGPFLSQTEDIKRGPTAEEIGRSMILRELVKFETSSGIIIELRINEITKRRCPDSETRRDYIAEYHLEKYFIVYDALSQTGKISPSK